MRRNVDGAITELQESAEVDPYNHLTWFYLASAHQLQGNREEALECVQQALRLYPEFADARRLLSKLRQ